MYDTLVLSGGSVKGIAILGSIEAILSAQGGKMPAHIAGTSVGAMIGLLLFCGYSPRELLVAFTLFKFTFRPILSEDDVQFIDGDGIFTHISNLVKAKLGNVNVTFSELAEQGKYLYAVAYNYTRGKKWIFCAARTPDTRCIDAVRASCALPGIFRKYFLDGDLYVDGGLASNFPMELIREFRLSRPIGITLRERSNGGKLHSGIFGLVVYMMELMFVPIKEEVNSKTALFRTEGEVIELILDKALTDFSLPEDEVVEMYVYGYNQALIVLR